MNKEGHRTGLLPKRSHHLPSYYRITPIGANAEVKINGEVLFGICFLNCYRLIVEISCNDLAVEKYTNVAGSRCFVQQSLIKRCPANWIYTLIKFVWSDNNTRWPLEDMLPAHLCHIIDCRVSLIVCESFGHAWEWPTVKIALLKRGLQLVKQLYPCARWPN